MRLVATLDRGATLLVGLDDAPPAPIQMGSPETGDFRGYEVDLLRDVARRLDVQLRYRRMVWSALIRALASGALDIVCSAATVTEDRRRDVDFWRPHLAVALAVVRRADELSFGVSLRAARVGVRRGTTAEAHVNSDGTAASIRLSESNTELYAALKVGEVDAVVDDSPTNRAVLFNNPPGIAHLRSSSRLRGSVRNYGSKGQRRSAKYDRCRP
jgi:polar amino acid transport system substrate-binding protein